MQQEKGFTEWSTYNLRNSLDFTDRACKGGRKKSISLQERIKPGWPQTFIKGTVEGNRAVSTRSSGKKNINLEYSVWTSYHWKYKSNWWIIGNLQHNMTRGSFELFFETIIVLGYPIHLQMNGEIIVKTPLHCVNYR